jgi:hypothetical protein
VNDGNTSSSATSFAIGQCCVSDSCVGPQLEALLFMTLKFRDSSLEQLLLLGHVVGKFVTPKE